ncbi:hypothetical protein MTO96_018374 [Rhipicephalus appendiculatus]
MSKSRINVDISSQTLVNVTRSSGSQPDMRPVTPPMMYQPMPGAAQQPQMVFVPPSVPSSHDGAHDATNGTAAAAVHAAASTHDVCAAATDGVRPTAYDVRPTRANVC